MLRKRAEVAEKRNAEGAERKTLRMLRENAETTERKNFNAKSQSRKEPDVDKCGQGEDRSIMLLYCQERIYSIVQLFPG